MWAHQLRATELGASFLAFFAVLSGRSLKCVLVLLQFYLEQSCRKARHAFDLTHPDTRTRLAGGRFRFVTAQ